MAIKYKFLRTATKRWAFPIAVVLLPGGFVLLAFAWFYKVLPNRRPAAEATAGEPVAVAAGGNFIAVMRMYSARARYELNCARRRQHALLEAAARPAPAAAAAEPRQEATIP